MPWGVVSGGLALAAVAAWLGHLGAAVGIAAATVTISILAYFAYVEKSRRDHEFRMEQRLSSLSERIVNLHNRLKILEDTRR